MPGVETQSTWVGANLDQWPGNPHLKPWVGAHPNQRPGFPQATTPKSTRSKQLTPSPCAQSLAGPTGTLGGRQNAQQRGAAGRGETAVPGKT